MYGDTSISAIKSVTKIHMYMNDFRIGGPRGFETTLYLSKDISTNMPCEKVTVTGNTLKITLHPATLKYHWENPVIVPYMNHNGTTKGDKRSIMAKIKSKRSIW